MMLLHKDKIVVAANRQRREFNVVKLKELSDGIKRNGLLHPVVIKSLVEPVLVAGERRFRVLSAFTAPYRFDGVEVQPGHIPITVLGDLSPLQLEEVELEENILREDLTWKEKTDAIAKLHKLRTAQAQDRGEKQTFTATANEIAGGEANAADMMKVRNATLLAPYLEDPDVKKAKSENEALSIIRKKLTQTFSTALAERFDVSKSQSPHTLHKGDCITILPQLPADTFDCIIVDPPYGINAHKMAALSGTESGTKHEYEDTLENALTVWESIFRDGGRVCKTQAHLYMFCDFRNWGAIAEIATASGWTPWPTPIVWYKPSGGMLGDSTRGPRKAYELIFFASRGDKKVTGVYFDVIVETPASTHLHAAAKPVELYINLLRRSCVPGDRILDPTAGSGTIFPAADHLRLQATGIEISETHYAVALNRMQSK